MMSLPRVTCIIGPTACGKTDAAIALAEKGKHEIISVDSAMIYRGMDIGTATPTDAELQRAPHRLINICDPSESYSVGEFVRDATREIEDILAKGKTPLLVGGTMMYFHQLQKGYSELPEADATIRIEVAEEAKSCSWPAMHAKLASVDPATAARLSENDSQRISRALEIYQQTGRTLSQLHEAQTQTPLAYAFEHIIMDQMERAVIHKRIEKRFDQMLAAGFLEEAKALYDRGDLNTSMPSIRCVGYRQAWDYFDSICDKATMREKAIIATRQLCKRQFTWLRRLKEEGA